MARRGRRRAARQGGSTPAPAGDELDERDDAPPARPSGPRSKRRARRAARRADQAPREDDDEENMQPGPPGIDPAADMALSLDEILRALMNPALTKRQRANLRRLANQAYRRERAQASEGLKGDRIEVRRQRIESGMPYLEAQVDRLQGANKLFKEAIFGGGEESFEGDFEDSYDDFAAATLGPEGDAPAAGGPSKMMLLVGGLAIAGIGAALFLRKRK